LLRLLANLDEVDVTYLCGSYLRFVVVRAGRLEKVMLDMWEPYVGFVEGVRAKCRRSDQVCYTVLLVAVVIFRRFDRHVAQRPALAFDDLSKVALASARASALTTCCASEFSTTRGP